MDILYIHPAKQEVEARFDKFRSCPPYPFIPVGVVGFVNMLRAEGYHVRGLNLPVELLKRPTFSLRQWLRSQRIPPKLVLIDLHWYEHSFGALAVAQAVKETLADATVVIGGLTTSYYGEEILADFPYVDYAIRGGGKESHSELAGRNGYVMRSPEAVVEDVARLAKEGFQQVNLSLDIATYPAKWWRAFFQQLRENEIRIGIYNEFFQLPSNDFIEQICTTADLAHTEVAISPLSGDEEVRRQNGKFYTNERFLRMLETLKKHEVPIFIYFSLNLPGETPQTFKKTLQLADQIGKTYPHHLLRMLNPCHTLDPMSPMSRQPDSFGMNVHFTRFQDYYNYCKGTGWEPRKVVRGQHRGFEMASRPTRIVEQMAQIWDVFAQAQQFRCFPVPRGW